jgi:hypothetical protein
MKLLLDNRVCGQPRMNNSALVELGPKVRPDLLPADGKFAISKRDCINLVHKVPMGDHTQANGLRLDT